MSQFPFIGPSYTSRSVNADCQRTVNLYPEILESGSGKNRMALYGAPGLRVFTTLPASPVRCVWANSSLCLAVAGSKLYSVAADGTHAEIGDVGDDAAHSPAQIFPSGNQLFVVSAGNAWYYNGSGAILPCPFKDQLDAPIGLTLTARMGAALDNYFVALPTFGALDPPVTNRQFYLSATPTEASGFLADASNWHPSDVGVKENYPDEILAILADHEELWLFGAETTEVWRNTGAASFPLERDPGAVLPVGIVAPWSAARFDRGVAWVGGDRRGAPVAYWAQGFQPVRVSTHAVEEAWASYGATALANAEAFVYAEAGHEFWQISFPDATWVYDAATQLWHQRGEWDADTQTLHRHRARGHAYVYGKHLVGDCQSGIVYEQALDATDFDSRPILRERTAPHLADEQRWHFYHRLQLDCEAGAGSGAGQTLALDWSDDGGHAFSTALSVSAGAAGAYRTRAVWRRLGKSRDRVFRVRTLDAGPVAWINAYLDVTQGAN